MSNIKGLKHGNVLHVSVYGGQRCDMWVVIGDMLFGAYDAKVIAGPSLPCNLDSDSTGMIENSDTFQRVKAEDIPDDVGAELAKWMLTQ